MEYHENTIKILMMHKKQQMPRTRKPSRKQVPTEWTRFLKKERLRLKPKIYRKHGTTFAKASTEQKIKINAEIWHEAGKLYRKQKASEAYSKSKRRVRSGDLLSITL